jgi:ABC-type Mn2+/Zn2+ transport system permease subunit
VLFGLVVTSFVQIGGVLLVFSYLIVPAVCANFLARRLAPLLAIGWSVATASSVVGLYAAYRFDFPTGAAIVCVLGVALVLAMGTAWVLGKRRVSHSAAPEKLP